MTILDDLQCYISLHFLTLYLQHRKTSFPRCRCLDFKKIRKEHLLRKTIVTIEFQEQKMNCCDASYSIYSLQ